MNLFCLNLIIKHFITGYTRRVRLELESSTWQLTPQGQTHLVAYNTLCDAQPFLKPRANVLVTERETFELLCLLEKAGWAVSFATKGRSSPPYKHGENKTFWIRHAATGFTRGYLMALLTARKHKMEVPHFKTHGFYIALMEGREYEPRHRGKEFAFGGDEPTTAKRRKVGPGKAGPGMPKVGEGEGSVSSGSASSGDERSKASSGKSGKSKGSGSSSGSSSSSSSEGSGDGEKKAKVPEVPKVGPSGGDWLTFVMPGFGRIVADPYSDSVTAHCDRCFGHGGCKLQKSLRKLPLGLLLAWLKRAPYQARGPLGRVPHRNLVETLVKPTAKAERQATRDEYVGMPSLMELFDKEQAFFKGEGPAQEPHALPLK